MAENSGFRVDRLGSIDARTGGKADHIFTILDYPWVAIWMSPRETIMKIVNRDPTPLDDMADFVHHGAIGDFFRQLSALLGDS